MFRCANLGYLFYSSRSFHQIPNPNPNLSSFHHLLIGCYQNHDYRNCIYFFNLLKSHTRTSTHHLTFPYALRSCTNLNLHLTGKTIHSYSITLGFEADAFIRTSLIQFYRSFREIKSCMQVFNLPFVVRDPIIWTTILSVLIKSHFIHTAHTLFDSMPVKDIVAWNTMISGYITESNIGMAKMLFNEAPVKDLLLRNTMLGGYAKHGDVDIMLRFFSEMHERDSVSWNSVISGLVRNDMTKKAINYFHRMQMEGFRPTEATMVILLSACSTNGDLKIGKWLHNYVDRNINLSSTTSVMTAVIHMYAKCGDPESSERVFSQLEKKDVVSWNAMIMGMAINGRSTSALVYFNRMMDGRNSIPNEGTILGVLCACTHGGLVEEGRRVFTNMHDWYGVKPKSEHYCCMVDLLGKGGFLWEAYGLIMSTDCTPNANIWGALLSGCRLHGNVEVAEIAVNKLVEMRDVEGGHLSVMSNIYAGVERWDGAFEMRDVIREKKVGKLKGVSLVDESCEIDL